MKWDYIESHWADFKPQAARQWKKLDDATLEDTGGRRDALCLALQQAYGINADQTEKQLKDWHKRLDDAEQAKAAH